MPLGVLAEEPPPLLGFEQGFRGMGTEIQLQAYAVDRQQAQQAFDPAKKEMLRLEAILSDYDEDSEVYTLRAVAGNGQTVTTSHELTEVLAAADRWHALSSGAFDASVGSLTRLWKAALRKREMPDPSLIARARETSGWDKLEFDPKASSLQIRQAGLRLDFGGIAKGYILDRAVKVLTDHGCPICSVNAGGDLCCGEAPPGQLGWKIAIAPLEEGGAPTKTLQLARAAIATSGSLWQYYEINGKRLSHLVDPRTGRSVEGQISVSVVAPLAVDADAAATAASVLGPELGRHMIERLPETQLLYMRKRTPESAVEVVSIGNFGSP